MNDAYVSLLKQVLFLVNMYIQSLFDCCLNNIYWP